MSFVYNISVFNGSTDLITMGAGVNSASGDVFSLLLVISIWVIVFGVLQSNFERTRSAFIGASLLTLFLSISLVGFSWITNGYVILVLIFMSSIGLLAGIMIKD